MSKTAILFAGFCGVVFCSLISTVASAVDIDFENPPFTPSSIIGQQGWSTNLYVLGSGPVNGDATISTSSPLVGSQSLLYNQTSSDPGDSAFGSDFGVEGVLSASAGVVGADLTLTYKINAVPNGSSAGVQQAGLFLSHDVSVGASPVLARINGTAMEVFTAGAFTTVPGFTYFAGDTLDVTYDIDFDAGTYDFHVVDPFGFSGQMSDLPFGESFVSETDGSFLIDIGILARQGTARFDAISLVQNPFNSLTLSVDRGNGKIALNNPTAGTIDFEGISILSADGAILPGSWLSIADNYDEGGTVSNDVWTESSATTSDLSEATTGVGSLTSGQEVDLGTGAWLQYYKEELVLEYFDAATQTTITAPVLFTGTGAFANSFAKGDLDFDGDVDGDDWNVFTANALTDTTGMTLAESYRVSDLDGDLISGGHGDFREFEAAFIAANGAGSFSLMLSRVPEPAAWIMLTLGAMTLFTRGRWAQHRRCPSGFAVLLAVGLLALSGSGIAQAQLVGTFEDGVIEPGWEIDNFQNGTASMQSVNNGPVGAATDGTYALEVDISQVTSKATFRPIHRLGSLTPVLDNDILSYDIYIDSLPAGGVSAFGSLLYGDPFSFVDGPSTPLSVGSNHIEWNYKDDIVFEDGLIFLNLKLGLQFGDPNDSTLDLVYYDNVQLTTFAPPPLTLQVNTDTGAMAIKNATVEDTSIDYYEIKSGDGSLDLSVGGWNSFSDQNVDSIGTNPGENWDEAGGSNASHVSEFFLLGDSELLQGETMDLGDLFSVGGDTSQLEFNFGTTDSRISFPGIIELVTGGFADADFDTDGDVDGDDLTTWQAAYGANASGDTNSDSDTDGADFLTWQRQFTGAGGSSAAAAVPEPGSHLLLCGALVFGAVVRSRRRKEGGTHSYPNGK